MERGGGICRVFKDVLEHEIEEERERNIDKLKFWNVANDIS